jgi:hypothetical protein
MNKGVFVLTNRISFFFLSKKYLAHMRPKTSKGTTDSY